MVEISNKRAFTNDGSYGRGTLLRLEPGRKYEGDVNYVDSMFDFRLYEVAGSGRKELELVPRTACAPAK